MSVLVSIQHPAHVHFFKHTIWELEEKGVNVEVVARKKDIALDLLNEYEIDYTVLAGNYNGIHQLATVQARYEIGIFRMVQQTNPDILMAIGEPGIAHVSQISSAKSFIFTDTEHATLSNALAFPFADRIYTPDCYMGDVRGNHITYPGYHELAYLHPNRFEPDPSVFEELRINPEDRIVIMRLVSWEAAHDVGDDGFGDVLEVVSKLESKGVEVVISAEGELPPLLKDYTIDIPIDKIHHLMYYSDLFLGESATMATECAVLGVPSILVSSSERGYTTELEEEYELVYNFHGKNRQQRGLAKALSILDGYQPDVWEQRHKRLVGEKNDTTTFIIEEIHEELGL